jgi:hypothetical protein
MTHSNIFWAIYVISAIYCVWRFNKRYQKSSHDGVIGPTPGLDLLAVLFLAPVLAAADLIVTGFMLAKKLLQKRNLARK